VEESLTGTLYQLEPSAQAVTRPDGHQRMNIVIVGHVDHGKSTVIGRLLADTH
jgi:GTPase